MGFITNNITASTLYGDGSQLGGVVGLVGQIKVLKNQQIPNKWIKMENINDDIALYFIK